MLNTPFIGRDSEYRFLLEQFAKTTQDGSRLILIAGPAGMGKTRLIQQFMGRLSDRCPCITGRGWDNRAAEPYHVLREAVEQLFQIKPSLKRQKSYESFQQVLAPFLLGDGTEGPTALPEKHLFQAIVSIFRAGADPALCVFLDDLQWADEGTFAWIDFALHHLNTAPILLLGAYRSEEQAALTSLLKRKEQWAAQDQFDIWKLEPLSYQDIETLTRQMVPENHWRDDLPQRVWEQSEGVPLFALEEVRQPCEDQATYTRGQDLITLRLNSLSTNDRELLTQAAVIGERFAVQPLAGALQQDVVDVSRRLRQLAIDTGIIRADKQSYLFSHNRYREALLADLSEDVRQAYHQRLTQSKHLSPQERTYHLVQGDQTERGVEALLQEGDQALQHHDWRDALRYYTEAQWFSIRQNSPYMRSAIYERMGDLQLLAANEPPIAKGYYEAALHWATSSQEKVRICCRLYQIGHILNDLHAGHYLKEAEQAVTLIPEHPVSGIVTYFHADHAFRAHDIPHAYELAKQALSTTHALPTDIASGAQGILLHVSGILRRQEDLQSYEQSAAKDSSSPWLIAQRWGILAAGYLTAGKIDHALSCANKALSLYKELQHEGQQASMLLLLGKSYLLADAYKKARAALQEALALHHHSFDMHKSLCNTWIYNRHPQGMQWATVALDQWMKLMPKRTVDERALSKSLHVLGIVERIFRESGEQDRFQRRLDELRQRFQKHGYRAEGVWYFTDCCSRAAIETQADTETWNWHPGTEQASLARENGTLVLHTPTYRGFKQMDMPMLTCPVSGDFAFEVTFASTQAVMAGMFTCREMASKGELADLVPGGGGILILRNERDALRLFAHIREPGEVICAVRQSEDGLLLGRGLLEDGPVHLRIEREDNVVRTYASTTKETWYPCGQVELHGWEAVEIGIFGECLVDLYPVVERARTTFTDMRLAVYTDSRERQNEQAGEPYPLPSWETIPQLPEMIVASASMRKTIDNLRNVAWAKGAALIEGETGTGKELVARAMHRLGQRAKHPFITLNCAAIPDELLERELFGHVRGAYTGAYQDHGGLFEAADKGILFLDEISDASPGLQAALLRVIEEQTIRRVGSQRDCRVDVRIVAATNQKLEEATAARTFRQDLYYRLSTHQVSLPPLRKRRKEIPALAYHALQRLGYQSWFTKEAMHYMVQFEWKGNVRELFSEVERAVTAAGQGAITRKHLSTRIVTNAKPPSAAAVDRKKMVEDTLRRERYNKSKAAERLGISRRTLYRWLEELGIEG